MSIKVSWDNPEKTVIRQDISGYWTAEEYVDSVLEMYDTMKTVTQTVLGLTRYSRHRSCLLVK